METFERNIWKAYLLESVSIRKLYDVVLNLKLRLYNIMYSFKKE